MQILEHHDEGLAPGRPAQDAKHGLGANGVGLGGDGVRGAGDRRRQDRVEGRQPWRQLRVVAQRMAAGAWSRTSVHGR